MKTVFHVALEPIDQRYTKQWYTAIPDEIKELRPDLNVVTIDGDISTQTTPGAFLDFALTNIWKNNQVNKIARMFAGGEVKAGDIFLFTDAWNSGIIQVKYMSELLGIPVVIHSIWHAGSYDPTDILGFTIKDKRWVQEFERSIYLASDFNWYGSHYHKNLFCRTLGVEGHKALFSGQPHKSILESCKSIPIEDKENIILFGHRISPDKNPWIFESLAEDFPDYKFVFSQKFHRSKEEYYDLIRRAKVSFSANNHENFGISMVEAVFNGTVPLVPAKLSYQEMYMSEYTYPAHFVASEDAFRKHRHELVGTLREILDHYPKYHSYLKMQQSFLKENYMTSKNMVEAL